SLDFSQRRGPARINLEGADLPGFAGVLGAVLALFPGRADAADEVEGGVEMVGEGDGRLPLADAEVIVGHGRTRMDFLVEEMMECPAEPGNGRGRGAAHAGLAIRA